MRPDCLTARVKSAPGSQGKPPPHAGTATPATQAWLERIPSGRPCVHVTESTRAYGNPFLRRMAIAALAGEPLELIAVTGKRTDPAGLVPGNTAHNVDRARWLSHGELMPRCDCVVSVGGKATVLAALEAGIPLVLVPATWDEPEHARRVIEGEGFPVFGFEPVPPAWEHVHGRATPGRREAIQLLRHARADCRHDPRPGRRPLGGRREVAARRAGGGGLDAGPAAHPLRAPDDPGRLGVAAHLCGRPGAERGSASRACTGRLAGRAGSELGRACLWHPADPPGRTEWLDSTPREHHWAHVPEGSSLAAHPLVLRAVGLAPRRCRAATLRAAIDQVLHDSRSRGNAFRAAELVAAAPGASGAAELIKHRPIGSRRPTEIGAANAERSCV